MSMLVKAMHELSYLCRKADVHGTPRVTITFDTPRDRALFEAEVKREMTAGNFEFMCGPFDLQEATICGIKVRVL